MTECEAVYACGHRKSCMVPGMVEPGQPLKIQLLPRRVCDRCLAKKLQTMVAEVEQTKLIGERQRVAFARRTRRRYIREFDEFREQVPGREAFGCGYDTFITFINVVEMDVLSIKDSYWWTDMRFDNAVQRLWPYLRGEIGGSSAGSMLRGELYHQVMAFMSSGHGEIRYQTERWVDIPQNDWVRTEEKVLTLANRLYVDGYSASVLEDKRGNEICLIWDLPQTQ